MQLQEQLGSYQQQLSRIQGRNQNDLYKISEALAEVKERLQAQIQARTEAEQETQAQKQARDRLEQELKRYAEQFADAEEKARSEAEQRAELERKLTGEAQARAEATQKARIEITAREQAEARLAELMDAATKTGTCECCGRDDIKQTELARIDSGQLFCPQCLLALKSSGVS